MNNIYLKFHELNTRRIHEDELGVLDLSIYNFLTYVDGFYELNKNIFIGSIDKKDYFAFVRQEGEDLYLDKTQIKNLMANDVVLVQRVKKEYKLKLILKRGLETIVATVEKRRHGFKYYTDKPLGKNIIVGDESLVVNGSVVKLSVMDITHDKIYASIEKVIGHKTDPNIDILKIVAYHNWPDPDMDVLEKAAADLKINYEHEFNTRIDLTDKFITTIDGADAKDLDDAISLEVIDGNYHLGVHIADVSLYVKQGSLIDKEAYKKSTSVYMTNTVIPMLPRKLSNDLCSLNPNTKKLTISCLMVINSEGKVISYDIQKTFIESKYRLNYDEVNSFINDGVSLETEQLNEFIKNAHDLSEILATVRRRRGELEFNSEEIGFVIDENTNKVLEVVSRATGPGEALIESFMLAANETVAFHMEENNFPSIYRIHEKPDTDKLNNALEQLGKLGIKFNKRAIHNVKELQKILKEVEGTEKEYIVNMTLLFAMMRAKYDLNPLGHFGLAARYYTHFTSPIRRYPDLILHRMIKDMVLGENNSLRQFKYYESILEEVSKHTSKQERTAIDIERDVNKLKSCEYLLDRIGDLFDGQIIQILRSGIFVKLNNGIEGYVNVRNNYHNSNYDENLLAYQINGKLYKIGDKVSVELIDVNMIEYEIDFIFSENKRGNRR